MDTANKISDNRAEAKICTTWESISEIYSKALAKYQKQMTLPGFRKGKVPLNVLEAKIGEEVLRDSCFEAMNNSMSKLFESVEEELRPLPYSAPEIIDQDKIMPFRKNADVNFTIRFDITPEVRLKEYKSLNVDIPNVIISDEMVDAEIERYRNQNSIVKPKGADAVIENKDLVTLDYEVFKGDDIENEKISDFTFTVGEKNNTYQFDDDILGMKEGEEKDFIKKQGEKDIQIKAKVKSIKVKELPEVDDEFAQDIKSEYKTVKDLRNGIKERLAEDLNSRMKETKIRAICSKILEDVEIAVPKSMVDYEIELGFRRAAGQYGMSVKDFEAFLGQIGQSRESFTASWREDAEKSIKEKLIIDEVEKRESIKADEDKVKALMEKQVPEGVDEERKKEYEKSVRDQLAFQATIDFLLENNNLIKGNEEIKYEDYASGKYLENSKRGKEENTQTQKSEQLNTEKQNQDDESHGSEKGEEN